MSKILLCINAQIKRDGNLPEHLEVLKLYNLMAGTSLSSSLLWGLITNCSFDKNSNRNYSIKPAFKELILKFNK